MESRALPPGTWILEFGPDGFGAVSQVDGDQVIVLENWLQRTLCTDSHGHKWIMEGPTSQPQKAWSLREKQVQYKEFKVCFSVGPTKAEHHAIAYLLSWPRCAGARSARHQ